MMLLWSVNFFDYESFATKYIKDILNKSPLLPFLLCGGSANLLPLSHKIHCCSWLFLSHFCNSVKASSRFISAIWDQAHFHQEMHSFWSFRNISHENSMTIYSMFDLTSFSQGRATGNWGSCGMFESTS